MQQNTEKNIAKNIEIKEPLIRSLDGQVTSFIPPRIG